MPRLTHHATTAAARPLYATTMRRLACLVTAMLWLVCAASHAGDAPAQAHDATAPQAKDIAAVVTVYHARSHADVIAGRLLHTDTMDGQGKVYPMNMVSLYTDQIHEKDISRARAAEYDVPIYSTIRQTLTRGTNKLAVDGVLLIAEHGNYPKSPTGNVEYPKRQMFEQIVQVFEESGRVVPVYVDKHIADNWTDAKWIYDTAQRMQIPLMAGSSVPSSDRLPETDVERDAELKEILVVSYHTLHSYGFHGLEAAQALAERRKGGETGIRAVQCITGNAVWEAGEQGVYDTALLEQAMARLQNPRHRGKPLREAVKNPVLCIVEYDDGLRVHLLNLSGAVAEWSAAWRYQDNRTDSTLFVLQDDPPYMQFAYLLNGIEKMMFTNKPTWPAERTLLTSGVLDALLQSQTQGGKRIQTPHLMMSYQSDWNWSPPTSSLKAAAAKK